jgi:hypothetical protein
MDIYSGLLVPQPVDCQCQPVRNKRRVMVTPHSDESAGKFDTFVGIVCAGRWKGDIIQEGVSCIHGFDGPITTIVYKASIASVLKDGRTGKDRRDGSIDPVSQRYQRCAPAAQCSLPVRKLHLGRSISHAATYTFTWSSLWTSSQHMVIEAISRKD